MKMVKKLFNVCLVILFVFAFGAIHTGARGLFIAAPDIRSKGRYYSCERLNAEKYYVEERNENTRQKNHGAIVERVRFGEYLVYDDSVSSKEFTHVIQTVDSNNYIVALHYPKDQLTPILNISRKSHISPWKITPCHIIGRIGLPSAEVYIEKTPYSRNLLIKSAVATPDIELGEVYNCVIPGDSIDEFTDIMSFLAAFLFK